MMIRVLDSSVDSGDALLRVIDILGVSLFIVSTFILILCILFISWIMTNCFKFSWSNSKLILSVLKFLGSCSIWMIRCAKSVIEYFFFLSFLKIADVLLIHPLIGKHFLLFKVVFQILLEYPLPLWLGHTLHGNIYDVLYHLLDVKWRLNNILRQFIQLLMGPNADLLYLVLISVNEGASCWIFGDFNNRWFYRGYRSLLIRNSFWFLHLAVCCYPLNFFLPFQLITCFIIVLDQQYLVLHLLNLHLQRLILRKGYWQLYTLLVRFTFFLFLIRQLLLLNWVAFVLLTFLTIFWWLVSIYIGSDDLFNDIFIFYLKHLVCNNIPLSNSKNSLGTLFINFIDIKYLVVL